MHSARPAMQAEELRAELGEVRAELKDVSDQLEEAEQELEDAHVAWRKTEVAQEEQQQRCLVLHLAHPPHVSQPGP